MRTAWGYKINSETALPDFITAEEFAQFTNGQFTGDTRITANIPTASAAIRNYCGWHISPELECEVEYNIRDLRDYFFGPDLVVQLPSRMVTEIISILLDAKFIDGSWTGDEITDFYLDPNGTLTIFDAPWLSRRSRLRIVFKSGFDDDDIGVIKELAAHRVTHAVTSSYGVTSESAGGVSITYNASWAGNTRSTNLPSDNKEVLAPYKVMEVI